MLVQKLKVLQYSIHVEKCINLQFALTCWQNFRIELGTYWGGLDFLKKKMFLDDIVIICGANKFLDIYLEIYHIKNNTDWTPCSYITYKYIVGMKWIKKCKPNFIALSSRLVPIQKIKKKINVSPNSKYTQYLYSNIFALFQ